MDDVDHGLVGGVIADAYPHGGRAGGGVLLLYGSVALTLVYRLLRRAALVREALLLAGWLLPSRWLDAWVNDLPRWGWPVPAVALLVWLLSQGLRAPASTPRERAPTG